MKALTAILLLLSLMALNACQHPCEKSDCGIGGLCKGEGECECLPGYSGSRCQNYDPCYGKDCGHGTCSPYDARCICDPGYEGYGCDTRQTEKFTGSFTVNEICGSAGTRPAYTLTVSQDSAQILRIWLKNLYNCEASPFYVSDSVYADLQPPFDFAIPFQQKACAGGNIGFFGTGTWEPSPNLCCLSLILSLPDGTQDTCYTCYSL